MSNVPEQIEIKEVDRFDKLAASLGEHFDDYVIIARAKDGGFLYKSSNRCWCLGAMDRLAEIVKSE